MAPLTTRQTQTTTSSNSRAKIILQSDKLAHFERFLRQFQWLPVHSRKRIKLATITYEARRTNSPQHLVSLIRYPRPVHSPRSSDLHFHVPTTSTISVVSNSFRSAPPVIRSSIPLALRTFLTVDTFKHILQTHYSCFPPTKVICSPCIRYIHDFCTVYLSSDLHCFLPLWVLLELIGVSEQPPSAYA